MHPPPAYVPIHRSFPSECEGYKQPHRPLSGIRINSSLCASQSTMKYTQVLVLLALVGAVSAEANGRDLKQYPNVYVDSPKTLPSIATPTIRYAYKDGIGAFQGWSGGLELPKTIDLGGVRVTRAPLRGRKLQQYPNVYVDSPKTLPSIATPTIRYAYKDGIGAFQGWSGGLELPKTIDLGGVRVTRAPLRGRKLQQYPNVYVDSPKTLPSIATPTIRYAYKDGIGAFQGWSGGLELPKTIDLGGVRVTRAPLRGKH